VKRKLTEKQTSLRVSRTKAETLHLCQRTKRRDQSMSILIKKLSDRPQYLC